MFTDIVGSTELVRSMGDEAWEAVLRWHDETLRTLIGTHRGEVVHTTGDGFFASFPNAVAAVASAVAVQRRLAEHRRKHGFAPPVRIGLHAAEATVIADDYAGLGVHEAARVGALAEGGEILATTATVSNGPMAFPTANPAGRRAQGPRGPRALGLDRLELGGRTSRPTVCARAPLKGAPGTDIHLADAGLPREQGHRRRHQPAAEDAIDAGQSRRDPALVRVLVSERLEGSGGRAREAALLDRAPGAAAGASSGPPRELLTALATRQDGPDLAHG
jgi:hypothetical protein